MKIDSHNEATLIVLIIIDYYRSHRLLEFHACITDMYAQNNFHVAIAVLFMGFYKSQRTWYLVDCPQSPESIVVSAG